MSISQIFFSFQGRLPRVKFFLYSILISIAIFIVTFVLGMLAPEYVIIIGIICSLLFIYPYLAIATKRFHDMNQNGTWFIPVYIIFVILNDIINFYPTTEVLTYIYYAFLLVMAVIGLSLLFTSGTIGENKYGKDPIDRTNELKENDSKTIIQKENNIKKKRKWGWILALSIPGICVLWILVSAIFYILGAATTDPSQAAQSATLLSVIKTFINRLLGMLALFSIPATIIGIILLVNNKKKE